MKRYLALLPLMSLCLTGCGLKSIKEDAFMNQFNEITAYLANPDNCPKDIHINDKLSVNKYDYKEGEFYSYRMFAIVLIVPILQEEYTWKEDGKYYYAEKHTDSDRNKYNEITEEQFNANMAKYKTKIMSLLNEPVNKVTEIMTNPNGVYASTNNKYYQSGKDGLVFKSDVVYADDNTKGKHTIEFANELPKKMALKKDGESYTVYKLNEAVFNKPDMGNNS